MCFRLYYIMEWVCKFICHGGMGFYEFLWVIMGALRVYLGVA